MPTQFSNVIPRITVVTLASIAMLLACVADARGQSFRTAGMIGVSMAGAEFGEHNESFSNSQPGEAGKDYIFNSADSIHYFRSKGIRLVRLPFRWERIQPKLSKPLDAKHLTELRALCRAAEECGAYVVLDLHNYARYRGTEDGHPKEWLIDESIAGRVPLQRAHFANLWRHLAIAFRNESSVIGYGLMNEPHDMGKSNWKLISQTAVNSIRRVDKRTAIIVGGDDWSSAERFIKSNGKSAWIRDPSKNTIYEAHCYFDSDASGKYAKSFAEERRLDKKIDDRGAARVRPFLRWCRANRVAGFVGEFGTPPESEWRTVTDRFLKECANYRVAACYWAAGEWWGDYPLSIQPADDFQSTATQLQWLINSPLIQFKSLEKSTGRTRSNK